MLIIAGTFEIDPAQRDAFIAVARRRHARVARRSGMSRLRDVVPTRSSPGGCTCSSGGRARSTSPRTSPVCRAPQPPSDTPAIAPLSFDVQQYEISGTGPVGS